MFCLGPAASGIGMGEANSSLFFARTSPGRKGWAKPIPLSSSLQGPRRGVRDGRSQFLSLLLLIEKNIHQCR